MVRSTKDLLEETIEILEQREGDHGSKAACFETIAAFWNGYLKGKGLIHSNLKDDITEAELVTPLDVALMMDLLKTARIISGDRFHKDHYLDKLGYSSIAGELMHTTE
jgi:hypothetical protein